MWSDNETAVDLLGFDYLVDSLEVVLTQPGLLPLTVGVLGDWGSGKTSLLRMAKDRLDTSDGYITVFFSPWRYEAYDDIKAALIDAILTRLGEEIPSEETEKRKLLDRLRSMVRARPQPRRGIYIASLRAPLKRRPNTNLEVFGSLWRQAL